MVEKCPYCLSKRTTVLTGTVYCESCQSYFRIAHGRLDPIFIENREVYRRRRKMEERKILCTPCQEKNELEIEKNRIKEEQKLKLNEHTQENRNTNSAQETNTLCRECIARINAKLEEDEMKYYAPYKRFVIRKRIEGAAVFGFSIILGCIGRSLIGSVLLAIFTVREVRSIQSIIASLLFCVLTYQWRHSIYIFGCFYIFTVFNRRKYTALQNLEFSIDIEKIHKEILRGIKGLRIEGKENRYEFDALEEKKRSFLHKAYNQHVKKNEEMAELAKGISNLRIKETWYGKVDKLVEWLATS